MKKLLMLSLLIPLSQFAQETKNPKIEFSASYGISYIDYAHTISKSTLNLDLPTIGKFYEYNLDLKLPKNRFIGIGYSRQEHSENVDDGILFTNLNTAIV